MRFLYNSAFFFSLLHMERQGCLTVFAICMHEVAGETCGGAEWSSVIGMVPSRCCTMYDLSVGG